MDMLVIDSDSEFYADSTDSEDQYDSESSYGGHAQSILSSLDESIGKINDFLAFERVFALGDIVCLVNDPSGQLGRVVDVDMVVDLETTAGDSIKDVNSKKLCRVRSLVPGDSVIMGPWIGKVERVFDLVTVVFSDGAKCEILIRDEDVLKPVPPNLFEDAPYFYYPGQRVRINHPSISKPVRWLCGKASRDEGTVCHVEIGSVHVKWITSVLNDGVRSLIPSNLQEPKNLTLLQCFQYANWQLGDWCTLPVDYFRDLQKNAGNKSATLSTAPKNFTKMQKEVGMNGRDCMQTFVISKTKRTVDVLWQNGNLSIGLDTQNLSPVNNLGDHDFWPEQCVLEKVTSEDLCVLRRQHVGVVRQMDAIEKTVKVKWIVPELKQDGGSNEEMVSAYELVEHPDFSYCIGDVVLRSAPSPEKMNENHSVTELSDEAFHGFLSYFGIVIGFKDGAIEVKWASGLISKVQPAEIFGLDRLLETAATLSTNEESIPENVAVDLQEQEKQLCQKDPKKVLDDSCGDRVSGLQKATSYLLPKVAFDFITNVTSSLFGSSSSNSKSGIIREESKYQILNTEELQPDVDDSQLECTDQQVEAVEQSEKPTLSSESDKPRKFKQFDVVNECFDHHFINESGNENAKRVWLKKIRKEWSVLENDLPDSICVRVYEERMDLLRACIVGAAGTPYHDGLFFFDIYFPPEYPHEPPLVHYNSGGLRLNPNLYESGKVCLSLLKTWTGSGSEMWNPESSTVLQVLLSLQALVLNEKPYFNEAGYDKQIGRAEGEKNSVTYNENAFLLSCKSMLYLLNKPPKHFEELVEEHFTSRSRHILLACGAYLNGAQVGHAYESDDGKASGENPKSCSTGFKLMLAKLLPKLVSAFTELGTDCAQFLDLLNQVPHSGNDSLSN
ncbi:probable ubiquitin-conjugating enzyme E2 24 [Ananas comosus]|uniref:E2 ubiquitin-conjugating enzyme n=1 Tax=Ananas comosus TaxID=4615 RepID=A0A6P5GKK0_ANACO|nr:probable ubiquitin-conjugating enzyme E2 24 [Ananas comosus]XP_020105817.1 probable ubiquitin-conjugating enzyme E2 24 [Ananas comosus]